jgi:uncharacterized membrane protein YoaK (UPF0700 family)
MIKSFFPLFGFIGGAILGAYLTKMYGYRSLLVPTGTVALFCLVSLIRAPKKNRLVASLYRKKHVKTDWLTEGSDENSYIDKSAE